MYIQKVQIKNFRLLSDVELVLEDRTTVIVGRNNSGKTSFSEVIRRFLGEGNSKFQLEDFSSVSYDKFLEAYKAKRDGEEDGKVRNSIPSIELRMHFRYDPEKPQLGPIGDFVVDLDPECIEILVVARYELQDGKIKALFDGVTGDYSNDNRGNFFRSLQGRIPELYSTKVWAEDPNDDNNRRAMSQKALEPLLRTSFINAQRGLDDNTSERNKTGQLSKIIEKLFTTASQPTANTKDSGIAESLQQAVSDVQKSLDERFNNTVKDLMPSFREFGYPGLGGPELVTETVLDVKRLLSDHTKVQYLGPNGVPLPESYNGLGMRNLIFILLLIRSFHKEYCAEQSPPGVHLIFIEEPEAHLHPQMQEVFIRKISEIVDNLNKDPSSRVQWPVQFVVSTHSSHVANEARFESIRYFLSSEVENMSGARRTRIKDLHQGFESISPGNKEFLHRYMTLTRSDLFFADKAVLVEGTSERLLLPVIIEKIECGCTSIPKLSSQYLTVIEVGGAYAHLFFDVLDFLELPFLVITDLDSVEENGGKACIVQISKATSNACIRKWFSDSESSPSVELSPLVLILKKDADKVKGRRRIAYQNPEVTDGPCGRSFEDAFMLANSDLFGITGHTLSDMELDACAKAGKIKKSDFALEYAIYKSEWNPPLYILDGLKWLAKE